MDLKEIEKKILEGSAITKSEAMELAKYPDLDALCDAADRINRQNTGIQVDSCSIINARSGMCGEDCKWCAQTKKHNTNCETYNFIDEEEVIEAARRNEKAGVKRFSMVTSGKRVNERDLPNFCKIYKRLQKETDLYLCASMGLLTQEQLQQLKDSGVKRYHCNLEASEKYFPKLCTSHTPEEKKATIRAAQKIGLGICSGGIIGMGESMEDRIDLAFELAELDVDSVPINILNPIKGTPLENTPLISEEEIIRTVAIFRFILPKKCLRFAGGRMRLSEKSMLRILKGGMTGALVGDMLTTVSNQIADDKRMFKEADLEF